MIQHVTGLLDLPAELIQQIHLLALNPFFPQTCSLIHDNIRSTSPSFAAQYLLDLYIDYGPNDILVRALRHPVCTVGVAQEVQRIWDRRRGYIKPTASTTTQANIVADLSPSPPVPPLRVSEIPRRLFRLPTSGTDPPVPPLLVHLFKTYTPSANSHKGYPLCRAVLTSNYQLITFLLENGADPAVKSNLAVEVAISMQDLRAVKMLVEHSTTKSEDRPNKRRRVEDRVRVDSRLVEVAMLKGTNSIVQYFVHEKGIMPPLGSIMKMGVDPVKKKKKTAKKARRQVAVGGR